VSTPCIIVNMSERMDPDCHGNENILPADKRPKYVHEDLESAEKEALHLHKKHAAPEGRFVIFQAIAATEWRGPFDAKYRNVAALSPIEIAPVALPERAPKKKRRKQP